MPVYFLPSWEIPIQNCLNSLNNHTSQETRNVSKRREKFMNEQKQIHLILYSDKPTPEAMRPSLMRLILKATKKVWYLIERVKQENNMSFNYKG